MGKSAEPRARIDVEPEAAQLFARPSGHGAPSHEKRLV